tara:strand:- start:1403 stop:2068 length:666 start_codon:yes stop_codon:yes gene_type:complete
MKYSVVLASKKKRYVAKKRITNPRFPNLVIRIEKKEIIDSVWSLSGKEQTQKLLKKKFYKRITKEIRREFKTKVEAYIYAYELKDQLTSENRLSCIHKDGDSKYQVYCFNLVNDVWKYNKFKKLNEHVLDKTQGAFYVGQTSNEKEIRYKQHINPNDVLSSTWGKNYFVQPYKKAIETQLIIKFENDTGNPTSSLLYGKSIIIEFLLTEWLKSKKYGAYSA